MIFCERLLPKKIQFLRFLRFFLLLKYCLNSAFISYWPGDSFYFISMVFLLFRRRRLSLEMFLAAESDGSRLFRSLMKKIQTIIYKIECPLLVLVDSGLKRCRDVSLAKLRSDQWCGFRSGKCHSFFKTTIKISRLNAFTWVEMSEISFTGLCHL